MNEDREIFIKTMNMMSDKEFREEINKKFNPGKKPVITKKKNVPHIIQEGSREHVMYWDTEGRHCSCDKCEVNINNLKNYKEVDDA
jgi:hypothetical protein